MTGSAKIVFHDNTGFFQGTNTREIGEESTISEGYEYYNIVNNQMSGTSYTGAQSFYDSVAHSEYVDGDDRIGSIAKSWIENVINLTATYMLYESAAAKVWL